MMFQILSMVTMSISFLFPQFFGLVRQDAVTVPTLTSAEAAIDVVLDDFHAAAAAADYERYFGHFIADAVFLGTDGSERWTVAEFKAFAKPYFDRGQGWTYERRSRHIFVNAAGSTAWFDEVVENANYGLCRGTGVLVKMGSGEWKIAQYNLVIPVPNDFAGQVVQAGRTGVFAAQTIYLIRHAEKEVEAGGDPGLSAEGRAHLAKLEEMLVEVEFSGVYSTNYARTRETAAVFATDGAEIGITLYDAGDSDDFVEKLRLGKSAIGTGASIMVVGHSNTIPKILRGLGILEEVTLEDDDYGQLFIIQLDDLGNATMIRLHF